MLAQGKKKPPRRVALEGVLTSCRDDPTALQIEKPPGGGLSFSTEQYQVTVRAKLRNDGKFAAAAPLLPSCLCRVDLACPALEEAVSQHWERAYSW